MHGRRFTPSSEQSRKIQPFVGNGYRHFPTGKRERKGVEVLNCQGKPLLLGPGETGLRDFEVKGPSTLFSVKTYRCTCKYFLNILFI
jgi:hypothetical protein